MLRMNCYHTGTIVCVFIIVSLEYTKNDPSTLHNGTIKVEAANAIFGKAKSRAQYFNYVIISNSSSRRNNR